MKTKWGPTTGWKNRKRRCYFCKKEVKIDIKICPFCHKKQPIGFAEQEKEK